MDNAKNFAKVVVSIGYDAAATSIVLSSGHGAKLPTAPFNLVWWNSTDYPDPSDDPNVEVVRCTVIATDTLTITRAQESTSASTKNTGGKTYKMIAGLTAKVINTDLVQTWFQPFQDRSSGIGFSGDTERIAGFYLHEPVTFSKIIIYVNTADATHNYSFGIFDSTGARKASTTAGTLAATGSKEMAIVEGTITLQPGKYYFGETGATGATAQIAMSATTYLTFAIEQITGTTTTAGAQPASITPPADSWTVAGQCYTFGLHN